MRDSRLSGQSMRYFIKSALSVLAIFLCASPSRAQNTGTAGAQSPETAWAREMNKYPGLLEEFGRLLERLQHDVQFPAARSESRLLPLLPESTTSYAAVANYGDVAHQALTIFRQELQQSSVLRDWWEHGAPASAGPEIENALEKLCELHQYLGEEIVVSGSLESNNAGLLVVAEVRRPGLKQFLQQMIVQLAGKAKPSVRVLDPEDLAAAKDNDPGKSKGATQELLVLVRPDFVVAALDLATLRNFNGRLGRRSAEFASTPFGQRVEQEYRGGVTMVAAADLHKMVRQIPVSTVQEQTALERSGFGDVKYLVWEHKNVGDRTASEAELSFTGPRHGPAAWLANSRSLNSLDFVSPGAIVAATVVLSSPAQILDDVKELASSSNANPFAALPVYEQALKLSLKDDLLSPLGGEFTVELDSVGSPQPVWKAMLGVKDADHLRRTLNTLLTAAHFEAEPFSDGGVTYYTVRIPSNTTTIKIGYAFVDGYLVIGSSQKAVSEAVALHRSGGSLAKSERFLASLPRGHSRSASAVFYQDGMAMAALRLQQAAPEMAGLMDKLSRASAPAVICLYGEESAIREASSSGAVDAGVVLVAAAVAIPNLLRSKIAANEASAVGSVRTVNTAQVTYSVTYPGRGYAPNLAKLGMDPQKADRLSTEHSGLISDPLGSDACTANAWCTKSGFQFRVTGVCKQQMCKEFVVVATPVDNNTGTRSFCSTSDGIIHFKIGPPLTSGVGVSECRAWPRLE